MTTYAEKLRSLSFAARKAPPKVTTHHTDTCTITETERSLERQDTHVRVSEAVLLKPKEHDA